MTEVKMSGRGRTSYQKKVKEQVRLELRQEKAAKKQVRKEGQGGSETSSPPEEQQAPENPPTQE